MVAPRARRVTSEPTRTASRVRHYNAGPVSHDEAALAPAQPGSPGKANLSVTALYTAETWGWGALPGAELLVSKEGRTVFRVTNFALAIARVFNWKLRSLRCSLLHRHTMIDHLLRESGARSVLELAAGLSRRGIATTVDPEVRYTEVDLGPMIAHKRSLLERTDAGRAALSRPNLRLVEGDVLEIDLASLAGDSPVQLVITEGLLMYLKPEQQRALWRKVRALFGASDEPARRGTLVFDLVPASEEPPPGPIGAALGWLMKRFTGGKGFERDPRTRHDIAAELREAGFARVDMIEPADVATDWALPHPRVPTRQLLFVAHALAEEAATP